MSMFPTRVLLATDGSSEAELAATTAAELVKATGSELQVVHVDPVDVYARAVRTAEPEEVARRVLDEQVDRLGKAGVEVARAQLKVGVPEEAIISTADAVGAGLIVVGSRGFGRLRKALMGSVSDPVVRHAHCPVMVVRERPTTFPARILVATDGSREAAVATDTALDLATRTGSRLDLIHVGMLQPVYHPERVGYPLLYERVREEAQRVLDEQLEKVAASEGAVERAILAVGRPDEEIVVAAEEIDADMVVIGSRGLGGVRRALMGSVSDSVVRHAHCSVLVVRSGA